MGTRTIRIWTNTRAATLRAVIVLSLAFSIVLLIAAAAIVVLRVFSSEYELTSEPALLTAVLLLCVAVVAWPWPGEWLRVLGAAVRLLASAVAVVWLFWSLFLPRAIREASTTDNPVTQAASTDLSGYASGVYTMAREVAAGTNEAWLPIFILVVLAILPSVRDLTVVWKRDHAVENLSETPTDVH